MIPNEREYDALRPVVVVIPGQPVPRCFRPLAMWALEGTWDADNLVKPAAIVDSKSGGTCPNLHRLISAAMATDADGIIMSVPIIIVGIRTVVIPGEEPARLCPDCKTETGRCRYATVIKPISPNHPGSNRRSVNLSIIRDAKE
jgi:hypothetical protein